MPLFGWYWFCCCNLEVERSLIQERTRESVERRREPRWETQAPRVRVLLEELLMSLQQRENDLSI